MVLACFPARYRRLGDVQLLRERALLDPVRLAPLSQLLREIGRCHGLDGFRGACWRSGRAGQEKVNVRVTVGGGKSPEFRWYA